MGVTKEVNRSSVRTATRKKKKYANSETSTVRHTLVYDSTGREVRVSRLYSRSYCYGRPNYTVVQNIRPYFKITYLECVTLVNKILLSFGREIHFSRICAHERVEKGVEASCGVRFRAQNATQSLCFLPPATKVTADLYNHIGFRNIQCSVSYLHNTINTMKVSKHTQEEQAAYSIMKQINHNTRCSPC
jgi:hypothetical protein